MSDQSPISEVSLALSRQIMEIFQLIIDDEEYYAVWAVVYQTVKAAIEDYETKEDRKMIRLNPSNN
jgi:hypothetical protein